MTFPTFQNHQYLNLETFRKNGQGIKTPVWFVQDGDALIVWTQADSGKAKRVRNNPSVHIAPCTADGSLLGEWIPAQASRDDSVEAIAHARALMAKKYGAMFHAFALMGSIRKAPYTAIKIEAAA
jgi:uncharacterized protein